MTGPLVIRSLTLDEMRIPVGWAGEEGWNPGLHDSGAFHAADPQGFLCAFVDGRPAACISVVRSGETFGFLGLYICHAEFRGQGFGWAVWQAGMAYLKGRTVGLDGVVAQQDNYRKSGFVYAHRNVRYQGLASLSAPSCPDLKTIDEAMMPWAIAYDRQFFKADRSGFLRHWLSPPGGRALVLVKDGALHGLGVIRPAREGYKIGPLFAETPDGADLLFNALLGSCPTGRTVVLDVPEPNREAVALAERHGLVPVFETARMYRGADPRLPLGRIYGITSFELG